HHELNDRCLQFTSSPDLYCCSRRYAAFLDGKDLPQEEHSLGELCSVFRGEPGHRLRLWLDCGSRNLLWKCRHAWCDPDIAGLPGLEPGTACLLQKIPPGSVFPGEAPGFVNSGGACDWLSS